MRIGRSQADVVQHVVARIGRVDARRAECRIIGVGIVVIVDGHRIRIEPLTAVAGRDQIGAERIGSAVVEPEGREIGSSADHAQFVLDALERIGRILFEPSPTGRHIGLKAVRVVGILDAGRRGSASGVRVEPVEHQIVLRRALQITRPQEPQVQGRVVVGFGIEIRRGTVAVACVFITPELQIAQYLVRDAAALLVRIAFLEVVDPALVLMVNRGDHRAEGVRAGEQAADAVASIETPPRAEFRVIHRRAAQRLITVAEVGVQKRRPAVLCPRSGHQVDRSPQRFGVPIGTQGLGQLDSAHDSRRKGIERGGPSAPERRRWVGCGQPHPAVGGSVQIGVHAADVDEPSLSRVGFKRNAGYALQSFGHVDVRKLDDLAQWLHFDDIRRLFFFFDCRRPTSRRAWLDDFLGRTFSTLGTGMPDIGGCGLTRWRALLADGGHSSNQDYGGGGGQHSQTRHFIPQ